jgi:hypothetical protein
MLQASMEALVARGMPYLTGSLPRSHPPVTSFWVAPPSAAEKFPVDAKSWTEAAEVLCEGGERWFQGSARLAFAECWTCS